MECKFDGGVVFSSLIFMYSVFGHLFIRKFISLRDGMFFCVCVFRFLLSFLFVKYVWVLGLNKSSLGDFHLFSCFDSLVLTEMV